MKKKIFIVLLACFYSSTLLAENCKPDIAQVDKISKQQTLVWEYTMYETSFGSSLVNTSEVEITLGIGRFGNANAIRLVIRKQEESTQNATFESQLKAIKGNEFYLGLKDSEPLKFVSNEVANNSQVDNLFGKLITTIVVAKIMNDKECEALKASLTSKVIDAIRVSFANGVLIEKTVKSSRGEKMLNKFNCFYNYIKDNPMLQVDIVSSSLPIDSTNFKVTYQEVMTEDGVSKDQLFDRAKSWMTNYFKSGELITDNKTDGKLSRKGIFVRTYTGMNASNTHIYTISISVKDGKYRYIITDVFFHGPSQQTMEQCLENIKTWPTERRNVLQKEINQKVDEGMKEVILNLKETMKREPSKIKEEW